MIIKGNNYMDNRGNVIYFNDFDFKTIKRFYQISNHSQFFIRAWHGHKNETKYFFASSGKILLGLVNLKNEEIKKYYLNSEIPQIIKVPKNYANGFMNLTITSKVIIFSDKTVEQSLNDDIRFPFDKWNIWDINNY